MEQSVNRIKYGRIGNAMRLRDRPARRVPARVAAMTESRTTRFDHFLIVATIVLLPLQEQVSIVLGSFSGTSLMFVLFGAIGSYLLFTEPQALLKSAQQPLFLASYLLLATGFMLERFKPAASYHELTSYGFMIGGGVIICALLRDRRAFRAGVYGYAISGIWLSAFLMVNFYTSFGGGGVSGLYGATAVRDRIFKQNWLETGLNTIAFIIAQGVAVAFTLAITSRSARQRRVFFAIFAFCGVATFLPMSRSGIVIATLSCAALAFVSKGKRFKAVAAIGALAICIFVWVPSASITRLWSSFDSSYYSSISSNERSAEGDARTQLYGAALESLPGYISTGVGSGNFWGSWGHTNGFSPHRNVSGAHNLFVQVTIYWGLPGLLAALGVAWQASRCVPRRFHSNTLSLAAFGIAVSIIVWMLFTHNIYAKEFSLAFGMLAACRLWIWPHGVVIHARQGER